MLQRTLTAPDAANLISQTSFRKFRECDSCLAMPNYRIGMYYYNRIMAGMRMPATFSSEFDAAKQIAKSQKNICFIPF